ncbi:MAG: TonB-dependent receptor [Prevotellaceae bacterium]|jgi:TonB-linked SusC/RagA family outer membrane protein|nr:TonB-dependent receptor [Prevotellaceae bacterium]
MKDKFLNKLKGLMFLFLMFPMLALAQNVTVSGTVSDTGGEPLPGVTVAAAGTSNATMTDFDGNYKITVPADARLTFSYIGYNSQTIAVGGKTLIDVVLEDAATMLNEVVAIGYGTMRRSDLTGAVTSITSDAVLRSVPTSLDQVLQGRAAGVQVMQNSGIPGASSTIRIRGINSINASTEPIYVIDGVVISIDANNSENNNPLAAINPQDIESMDILKDASATAIYGAQASNGVIIINTKRGLKGDAKINYNSYVGWQQLPKHLNVLNLQQYATLRNIKADNGLLNYSNDFARPDLLGPGTDWQSELFNLAMMNNHNLSVAGGSDKITYNLSAGYSNQDGIAEGSGFRRLSLSGGLDAQVKEWARAGVNFGISNTNQKLTVSDQSLVLTAIRSNPYVPVRNADGTFGMPENNFMPTNPIAKALLIDNHNYNSGARANTFFEYLPTSLKGFSYKTEFSFDFNFYNSYRFEPTYNLATWDFKDINQKTDSKQYNVYYSWRNILTYDKTFGLSKLIAMLGQEMSKSIWEYLSGYRPGLPTNGATDLNMGDETKAQANGYTGSNALLSYFGRLFYSFDDRYMLTATLRRDGSSKFAPANRWGWFPSFALAWRGSQESFLKDNETVSNLKLRAGWGLVGNQNIPDNHAWLPVYSPRTSPWGTGLIANNTPNENLKWESTSSANIGLDLGLFKNRIDLVVDFYYKKTNNLLMEAALPGYVGTGIPDNSFVGGSSPPWVNLGSLENKGFEITLNTQNIATKNFQWNTSVVFSYNRNKVLSLNTASGEDTRSASDNVWGLGSSTIVTHSVAGEPIGQFYGYEVIGRFEQATDFYMYNEKGKIVRTPVTTLSDGSMLPISEEEGIWIGDYIYRDKNGDGVINEKDRTIIGNPEPKFTFGINNNFSIKNWDFGIQLVGVYGNDVVNYIRRYMDNPYYNNSNLFVEALDYAQLQLIDPNGPNDYRNVQIVGGDAHTPRLSLGDGISSNYNYMFSNRFVEDGSYLRIQNVSLGFNFVRDWLKKTGVNNVKLYVNLQNLYTFTKYRGFDPEIGTQGNGSLRTTGVDTGRYPSPRIYTFGVNLTF